MPEEEEKDEKPAVNVPVKSSMEILSELFNSFDAEPPLIVKQEKSEQVPDKKSKKSKKKHKHKEKKHKKDKKRKRSNSSSSSERSEIDLAEILIKQEKDASSENKIKIEGTKLSVSIDNIKLDKDIKKEKSDKKDPKNSKHDKKRKEDKKDSKSKDAKKDKTEKSKNKTDREIKKEKPNKSEKKESKSRPTEKGKIEIKLKSVTLESIKASYTEEGEISDSNSDDQKDKKRKHKSESDSKSSKKKKSEHHSKIKLDKTEDLNSKIQDLRDKLRASRHKDRRSKSKEKRSRSRELKHKDHDFYKSRDSRGRGDSRDRHRDNKSKRNNPFYKEKDDDFWSRDRHRGHHDRHSRDRDSRRHRSRSPLRDSSYIDKKKLLEIARKNAIHMMKSGSLPGALTLGPQAQEKVIAAIKSGGKTIEELTDFCKTLSTKEELGELSSNPDESDSDNDTPFHHPFQIKDRPSSITMNIKNSVPLPIKSTQERSSELRLQFPVSSGTLHRKTENEWVPVSSTKKSEQVASPKTNHASKAPLAIEAPPVDTSISTNPVVPPVAETVPQLLPSQEGGGQSVDIGSIVSQRLTAMRKLQENPNDVQALTQMYKSNKEMQTWAESKQQFGQFTGSTGAQILSQAELSSGYQAWAKKDQLTSANPVSGGMGMHLLQKMGWKPGEGLGKEKTGALEPLLLEVKLDKKGLVANEEQKKKKRQAQSVNNYSLQNKHPVSLLGEFASKRKLGAPQYILCFECGPDHKKNFLFKVFLNGVEYKPNIASPNKKVAKANAAMVCLQHLGVLQPPPQPVAPST